MQLNEAAPQKKKHQKISKRKCDTWRLSSTTMTWASKLKLKKFSALEVKYSILNECWIAAKQLLFFVEIELSGHN